MKIKGQNLRLKWNDKYFAFARTATIHIAKQTEDASTKDDTGDWSAQEIVGKSWDATTSGASGAAVLSNVATSDDVIDVEFLATRGEKNRQENTEIPPLHYYGKAIINDFSLSANNRETASYEVQLQGYGQLTTTPPGSSTDDASSSEI